MRHKQDMQDSASADSDNDDIDQSTIDEWRRKHEHVCEGPVRALVYPLSPAARLACNANHEADDSSPTTRNSGIIPLRSCAHRLCTTAFNLGILSSNHVTFVHDEEDYTPLCYARIYPDPDGNDAELYVPTNSRTLSVGLADAGDIYQVEPGRHLRLQAGRSWSIQVTRNHKFGLVLPPACELYNSLLHEHVLRGSNEIFSLPSVKPREIPPVQLADKIAASEPCKATPKGRSIESTTLEEAASCSDTEIDSSTHSSYLLPSPHEEEEELFKNNQTTITKVKHHGKIVVIKRPRDSSLAYAGRQWETERSVLLQLSHPNIIKLIEFNPLDLSLHLEYGGRSLAELVNATKHFTVARNLAQIQRSICAQVAAVLQYLSTTKELMHCDIKPHNILLSDDHRIVKVCDFGLSRNIDSISTAGGTPQYVAPELMINGVRAPASDVWALGVTMLFVLNIMPLPDGGLWRISRLKNDTATQQKMRQWLSKVAEAKEEIPENWSVLRDMLHVNHKKRITATELVERLETAVVVHDAVELALLEA